MFDLISKLFGDAERGRVIKMAGRAAVVKTCLHHTDAGVGGIMAHGGIKAGSEIIICTNAVVVAYLA